MPISAPKIPDGLPELMRGLAKSVIKENPENLYVHAAEYFENLIRQRDGHLEKGYSTFNAYQVYADYREKSREKLGLTKDPSLSDGNGGDGDESGSAGSDSQSRGRKRRRARKPSSREKDTPVPAVVGKPDSGDDGAAPQLASLSEESGPVPVVEQEVVKVHFNPPEAPPGRVVSAQSVEADQAVSSVLDDELMLDSDGTGGKETGDELVDNGDEIRTAPSTAEATEQSQAAAVDAEPISEMALQDMETCFMHANVDDLLEKHSDEELKSGDDKPVDEGEDIPEGPEKVLGDSIENVEAVEPASEEFVKETEPLPTTEAPEEETKNGNEIVPTQLTTPTAPDEADMPMDVAGNNGAEKREESASQEPSESVVAVSDDLEKKPDEAQSSVEPIEKDVPADSGDAVEALPETAVEPPVQGSEPSESADKPEPGEEIIPESQDPASAEKSPTHSTKSEENESDGKENESSPKVEETKVISSRFGIDEEDPSGEVVSNVDAAVLNDGSEPVAEAQEGSPAKSLEETENLQENEPQTNKEELKEESSANIVEVSEVGQEDKPESNDNEDSNETVPDKVPEDQPAVDESPSNSTEGPEKSPEKDVEPKETEEPEEKPVSNEEPSVETESKKEVEESSQGDEVDENKTDANKDNEEVSDQPEESQRPESEEGAGITEQTRSNDEEAEINEGNNASDEATLDAPSKEASDESNSDVPSKEALNGSDNATTENMTVPEEKQQEDDEKTDDIKTTEEGKNEGDIEPSNEEVNAGENVTDGNDLLTTGRSLEDVALADATENATEIVPDSAGGELKVDNDVPDEAEMVEDDVVNDTNKALTPEEPSKEETVAKELNEDVASGDPINETAQLNIETSGDEVKPDGNEEVVPTAEKPDQEPTVNTAVSDEVKQQLSEDKPIDEKPESLEEKDVEETDTEKPLEAEATDSTTEENANVEIKPDQDETLADEPSETKVDSSTVPVPDASTEKSAEEDVQPSPDDVANDATNKPEVELSPQEDVPKREASLEEVVEEQCVKREISPSKSVRLEKSDSSEKQVEELEEIKKVDLSQLSKDSAEALFYSLKKSELENQDPEDGTAKELDSAAQENNAEDDDKDVVVKEEPRPEASGESPKRTFTNDFLDEDPIPDVPAAGDGVEGDPVTTAPGGSSLEAGEQEDAFNPMVMVSMRSKQFQEQLHSREADELPVEDSTPKRPTMRRCMTEMSGLQRFDAVTDEDTTDSRQYDPAYVEEEDQFDGYYIGHIKNKILASSVSVADSDCGDPTRSSVESVDENNVRTALETIASTDTESTIASQATIQQAGRRSYLRKHSQNTSSNIPYASFGNAAIDKSLDEFIEREEQHKQDEALAEAATKIQRSYRTHKKKLLRDYHSTMRTFTEDQSAESGEEYAANVIQIKLDQRRPGDAHGDAGEESDSTTTSLPHQPLGTAGKRPMYSLNIDEYDTVARRMTLTRGVAMQRNSTPDDDSGKSANASTDRKPSLSSPVVPETTPGPLPYRNSSESSEERVAAPGATGSSGEERENKDPNSSSRSKPKSSGRTSCGPLDVQSLLLIARQHTMPVQIDSSVIRVLPKHMRKRISSAGMLNGNNGGKRK